MNINNVFDAPVPGQSLTQPPGASAVEHPPLFVHLDEALEYVWDKLHKKKALVQMEGLMKGGIPCEALARTLLYQGMVDGKWTVDLALLMYQTVIWQLEAVAKLKGIKVKTFNDDKNYDNFMTQIDQLLQHKQDVNTANTAMDDETPDDEDSGTGFKGFF